jgi:5-methylcytosine-specific restriction endonuclease McrA
MRRKPADRPKHCGKLRRSLWLNDPHCHYCGRELAFEESTLDHKLAKGKGGTHEMSNLVLSCLECNHEKGDGDYESFVSEKCNVY